MTYICFVGSTQCLGLTRSSIVGRFTRPAITPMGMVVATAVLSEAVNVYRVIDGMACWADKGLRRAVPVDPYGDFTAGRWLWFLEDIHEFPEPIPAVGHQGFWNWTPELVSNE